MSRQRRIFASAIGHVFRGLISVFMAKTHTDIYTKQLQQQKTTKIHSSRLAFTTCLQRGNGNGSPTVAPPPSHTKKNKGKHLRVDLLNTLFKIKFSFKRQKKFNKNFSLYPQIYKFLEIY